MRNYLRVRGEYGVAGFTLVGFAELPPRARRILANLSKLIFSLGTTSACAENTRLALSFWLVGWNYLRVRGEYGSAACGG